MAWSLVLFWQMKYLLLVDHQCIVTPARGLQKDTFSLSLPDRLRSQHSPDRLIKDLEISVVNCSVYSSIAALTCLSPLWVRAEHSRYLTARILFASFWPCSLLIGEWPLSARACRASLSSLRSILVPDKQNSVSLYLSPPQPYLSIKWEHRDSDVLSLGTILR